MIFANPLFSATRPPLQAFVSPLTLSKTINGDGTATTAAATASFEGGWGDVTYSWSCTNGAVANSPTSATTTFSRYLNNGQSATSVATVTITDKQTGQTAQATVNLTFTSVFTYPPLGWTISPANQQVFGNGVPSAVVRGVWTVMATGGSGNFSYTSSFVPTTPPLSGGASGNTLDVTFDVPFGTSTGGIWIIDITDNITGESLHLERGMTFTNPNP